MSQSKQVPLLCRGHSRPVVDVFYSPITPDGFFFISGCKDGKPMLRQGTTGDWIGTFLGHKGAVWSSRLNSTATRAATGSADFSVKFWDAITGDELRSFAHNHIVKSVAFSKDDQKLLTGGQEKILRLYDLQKPEEEPLKLEGHKEALKFCLFDYSAGDQIIVSSGQGENVLRVWDLRTKSQVKSISTTNPVANMELSYGGKFLTAASQKEVILYDAQTFEVAKTFTMPVNINSASLNPDGTRLVIGGIDNWVRVFDTSNGEELEVLKGHHGEVHCVKFAPDGETYASGSEDGTIRLWQTVVKCYELWQLVGKEEDATSNNNNNSVATKIDVAA